MAARAARLVVSLTLLLSLLAVASAGADTSVYSGTFIFSSPIGQETDLSQDFPLFYDPGCVLTGVTVAVDGTLTGHGSLTTAANGGIGYVDLTAEFLPFDPRVTTGFGAGDGVGEVETLTEANWSQDYNSSTGATFDTGPQTASGGPNSWTLGPADLANFVGTAAGQTYTQYLAALDQSGVHDLDGAFPVYPGGSASGSAQVDSATATVTLTYSFDKIAAPEPASPALLALALPLLGLLRRRR